MYRVLLKPENLFLAATLQALSPYLLWHARGPNPYYHYDVTWFPPIIWLVGCASFWLGARLIRGAEWQELECVARVSLPRLTAVTLGLIGVAGYQIYELVQVYGQIPLLGYFRATMDIGEADAMLSESSVGQVALLLASLYSLNAMLLLLLLKGLKLSSRSLVFGLLLIGGLVEFIGFSLGGKRQGLVMAMFYVFCGLAMHTNDPGGSVLRFLRLSFLPVRKGLYLVVAGIGVLLFELIGLVRSEQQFGMGITQVLLYLELPLLNLEYQCELAGLGPNVHEPAALLRYLLPNRISLILGDNFLHFDAPPRLEPSSMAGFFGELHWRTGLPGVALFAALAGAVSKFCYVNATKNLFLFLTYCQIAWTLLAAHSYNHFLNLPFLPLPAAFFLLFSMLIATRRSLHEVPAQPGAFQPALQLQHGGKR